MPINTRPVPLLELIDTTHRGRIMFDEHPLHGLLVFVYCATPACPLAFQELDATKRCGADQEARAHGWHTRGGMWYCPICTKRIDDAHSS